MAELRYRRVIVKVSGEGFGGEGGYGIDPGAVRQVAETARAVVELGVELGIVVGGGNILRGESFSKAGVDRTTADYMGMVATILNALALQDQLERLGTVTRVLSSLHVGEVAEPYIRRRAMRHLEKGRIVILAAGTGNPHFTTDTAAALRAVETRAQLLVKATNVDGVYSSDPAKDPKAKKYDRLTYLDVLNQNLRVMDHTAITLCREQGLPVCVLNLREPGALSRAIRGEKVGTLIVPPEEGGERRGRR